MDTIVFFRIYTPYDDPRPYIALKEDRSAYGLKSWITSLKDSEIHICWFKIQCHKLLGVDMPTQQDLNILRTEVEKWLNRAGLCLSDFTLSRIDYDYNFFLKNKEAKNLLKTMQQLSKRILRMEKWISWWEKDDNFNDSNNQKWRSVYYKNKSRHAQVYSKTKQILELISEVDDKKAKDKASEIDMEDYGLCRQEVQCHASRIKYMKRQYKLERNWETWVTPEMEQKYLITAEPIFLSGDFYALNDAVDIIQASSLTPYYKQRLSDALTIIQTGTMDELKATYSRNTIKTYLAKFKELNINPLTIPENEEKVTFIKNPFFRG